MSETTDDPSTAAAAAEPGAMTETPAPESETAKALEATEVTIQSLLEAGVHFGHQTHRWNPRMRNYIFGERNGTHIIDLDQTLPLMREALDFIRETLSEGGYALFVGTKRQAAPSIKAAAVASKQSYVNNRWLGGMLTNWKTVKKSIERYKNFLEIQGDEEKRAALSKKELARISRACEKYAKSLDGMKEMNRLPQVVFVIDIGKESIAVSEAKRLGIPVVGVVDSNCNPDGIDFPIPGNDDAIRSVELYCSVVANACVEGARAHAEKLQAQPKQGGAEEKPSGPSTGRRVVEIKQAPRRGRGDSGSGRTRSSGGWADRGAASGAKDAAATAPAAPAEPPAAPAEPPVAPAEPPVAPAEAPAPVAQDAPSEADTPAES